MEQEFHFIQNVKLRETIQTLAIILGIIGVILSIVSFLY